MTDTGGHIFISYAREDQSYARSLADALCQRGFDVWIDDRIDFGARWWSTIEDQIRSCGAFVVVMTPDSEASEWVESECLLAREERKEIIPLLLRGNLFSALLSRQCVDVSDGGMPPEGFYQRLAQILASQDIPPSSVDVLPEQDESTPFLLVAESLVKRGSEPLSRLHNLLASRLWRNRYATAFVSWLVFLVLYAGGIWGFRRILGTPWPTCLDDLCSVAPGYMFYYPDWNAITFDGVLNPVLATLVSVLPGLIGKRLLELSQSGFLRAERGDDIRRWKLVSRIAFVFCLALAVATVIASWFSRYRYYVDDLLLFRLYVLLLVGLSTYVRWSLLILAVRTVALFLRSELQLPKARWARSEYVLQALGELGILVFAAFYGVVAYAAATMGTAVVKGVPLQSDALFWEATVHVVVSFVGAGLALMCLVYRPHAVLLAARQESSVGLGAKIPTLPILKSIWRQAILLVPFFLLTLIPWLLWVTGLVAEG